MKLTESDTKFPIVNYDLVVGGTHQHQEPPRHGPLLPNHIRGIIAAASSTGKTNFLMNLLLNKDAIKFSHIILCSKSQEQDKYAYLEEVLKAEPDITFRRFENGTEFCHQISEDEIQADTTLIFDDVDNSFDPALKIFFTRGRHVRVDVIYLLQSYAAAKKHSVRDNANFIVLFAQDGLNLSLVWRDHAFNDMPYPKFVDLCRQAWRKPYNCFIIDKTREMLNGRYRSGMDKFFTSL